MAEVSRVTTPGPKHRVKKKTSSWAKPAGLRRRQGDEGIYDGSSAEGQRRSVDGDVVGRSSRKALVVCAGWTDRRTNTLALRG